MKVSLIMSANIQLDHLLPIRPIMRPAIPQSQCVPDVVSPQRFRKLLIRAAIGIVPAGGENDVHPPERREARWIVLVGNEVAGVVEVAVGVVIAADERP